MSPTEFADMFHACRDGRDWAVETCATMDEVWAKARPDWLLWIATRRGVLDDRALRLFAVWSARRVQHLMTDARSIAALDVAEKYANGQATDNELAAARAAAQDAARAAAWAAASDAASAAARAAQAAAGDASGAAAWAAASATEWDATRAAQAAWLRSNAKPDWERAREMGGAR